MTPGSIEKPVPCNGRRLPLARSDPLVNASAGLQRQESKYRPLASGNCFVNSYHPQSFTLYCHSAQLLCCYRCHCRISAEPFLSGFQTGSSWVWTTSRRSLYQQLISIFAKRVDELRSAAVKMAADQASVYTVHLEKKDVHPDSLEASNLEILSSVVGSHDKAKEAILYNYKNVVTGFSAKLTPEQVTELSKKPGVLAVNPQGVAQLHGKASTQQGAVSGRNAV